MDHIANIIGLIGIGIGFVTLAVPYIWKDLPSSVTTPALWIGVALIMGSVAWIVFLFRKKLSPARLIGFVEDSWLAVRSLFIREWLDPSHSSDMDRLADQELVTGRDDNRRKEQAGRTALIEKNHLANTPISQHELNMLAEEIAELAKEVGNFKFLAEMSSDWIETDILRSLRQGTILAKGFLSPHVARRRPVIIPPHEWGILSLNTDEYDNAKAIGAGVEYIGVKLARRSKPR